MENNTNSAASPSGYGKRPMWQWILLYLVVGGLAYAAIYYFWLMPQGSASPY